MCGMYSKTPLTSSTPMPFWWSQHHGKGQPAGWMITWLSWHVRCHVRQWITRSCSPSLRPSPREQRASSSLPSRSIRSGPACFFTILIPSPIHNIQFYHPGSLSWNKAVAYASFPLSTLKFLNSYIHTFIYIAGDILLDCVEPVW